MRTDCRQDGEEVNDDERADAPADDSGRGVARWGFLIAHLLPSDTWYLANRGLLGAPGRTYQKCCGWEKGNQVGVSRNRVEGKTRDLRYQVSKRSREGTRTPKGRRPQRKG